MKVFIVAIPLFNAAMTVEAYRLRDQRGDKALSVQNDFRAKTDAWLSPGLDLLAQVGTEPFAADRPLFVDINKFQLLMGRPTNLDIEPKKLVCVISGGLPADAELIGKCRLLKEKGYGVAIENFPLAGMSSPYFETCDYLLLKHNDVRYRDIVKAMAHNHPRVRLVISGIPASALYEQLSADASTCKSLFSGAFYANPITKGVAQISPLKVNALQLLREINQNDFELSDISQIIGRDPALTISLLKFINSNAVGLSRKVDSIRSAVAIMGQQEVRRWGTVAISVNLAEDRPGEVTRLSLIRAKFAENLAGLFELGIFVNQLFMAGLFSLLDVILRKPMDAAIQEVAVDERVRQALVEHTGDLAPVMDLIYTYEKADFDQCSIQLIRHNIDVEDLNVAFVNALKWYNDLLSTIEQGEPS